MDTVKSDVGLEVLRQVERIERGTRQIAKAIGVIPGRVTDIESNSTEIVGSKYERATQPRMRRKMRVRA
jgi:hypothetical protein